MVQTHVLKVDWLEFEEKLKEIRLEVFVNEQEVPQEEELDGLDEESTHFIALNEFGQHVGCARLLPSGQIGRMAVNKDIRGSGVGAQLLDAAVAEAQAQGLDKVYLHAQLHAEEFYRKGGFISRGDRFMDAGIEHTTMEMMLPFTFEAPSKPIPAPVKTESKPFDEVESDPCAFEDQASALEGLVKCVGQARRHIFILSPYLDHDYFTDERLVQSISELARSAPKAEVRILIMSSKFIVMRGHPLVELARRLDEKISIQVLDERISKQTSSFVCVDQNTYWLLPDYDAPEGVYDVGNPVMTNRLQETFQTAWDKSRVDPELRQLSI